MATPDDNNTAPLLVVDNNGNVAVAKIDNATGYLLIDMENDATTPTSQNSTVDPNNTPAGLVVDDSDNIVPILTNSSNKIYINFTQE